MKFLASVVNRLQFHLLCRLLSTLTSPASPWGLRRGNTSIMWSAILISHCLEYSTTPFLRKCHLSVRHNIIRKFKGDWPLFTQWSKDKRFLTVCVFLFILAAPPSVIQTATFLRAAGSIHPAQRLQWKPRGPVVKETFSSNMGICTHTCMCRHTHIHAQHLAHSRGSWFALFTNDLPDVLYKLPCRTNKRLIIWTNVSVCMFLSFLPSSLKGAAVHII